MRKITAARTLIVDDEPLIRWSLGKALRDRGCAVVEAGDARTALELASTGAVDLVLLDLKLPDSEDLSLLTRLRGLLPAARFIMMTAFGTPETKTRAIELGAAAIVDKPFLVKAVVDLALAEAGDDPR
jgi:DNA-binding response OmpR family regulator